ncbi:MAG: hypothetical protein N2C14_00400 [Planctomycetales bacterium]
MWYRLLDLVWALMLLALLCSGTGLVVWAAWSIAQQAMRAIHAFLTCWEYSRQDEQDRDFARRGPITRRILTLEWDKQVLFPFAFQRSQQLRRLRDYRLAKARREEMMWDPTLAALLTADEYAHLHGSAAADSPAIP